jgi:soluble lytic murein transglycosylase-like protein
MEDAADHERARKRRLRILLFVAIDVLVVGIVFAFVLGGADDDESRARRARLPAFVAEREQRELAPVFERWADEYDVSVTLLEALAWRESRWDNTVRSPAGAIGIGQLLPETAAFVARELIGEELDPTEANDNIRLSAQYLRALIERFERDVSTALAAYLQGSTSVEANGVSPKTAAYVEEVLALRDDFAAARRPD